MESEFAVTPSFPALTSLHKSSSIEYIWKNSIQDSVCLQSSKEDTIQIWIADFVFELGNSLLTVCNMYAHGWGEYLGYLRGYFTPNQKNEPVFSLKIRSPF